VYRVNPINVGLVVGSGTKETRYCGVPLLLERIRLWQLVRTNTTREVLRYKYHTDASIRDESTTTTLATPPLVLLVRAQAKR
jgi:hypothetical protein